MKEDKKNFNCRVEETFILDFFPSNIIVDIYVFQQPNVLAVWIIRISSVSEVVGMAIVPALHGLGCDSSVKLLMVVIWPGHCGLVDQVLIKAETIEKALGATSTVTGASICCWRCWQDKFIDNYNMIDPSPTKITATNNMPVFRTVKSWLASSFIHNHIIIQNTLPNVASATVMKIIS